MGGAGYNTHISARPHTLVAPGERVPHGQGIIGDGQAHNVARGAAHKQKLSLGRVCETVKHSRALVRVQDPLVGQLCARTGRRKDGVIHISILRAFLMCAFSTCGTKERYLALECRSNIHTRTHTSLADLAKAGYVTCASTTARLPLGCSEPMRPQSEGSGSRMHLTFIHPHIQFA